MLPLAEEIAGRLDKPSGQVYYGLSQAVEPGVTGRLQIVLEAGKIISCAYDEIFADRQEEIEDPELKPYYRQSKISLPGHRGPGSTASSTCSAPGCWRPRASPT